MLLQTDPLLQQDWPASLICTGDKMIAHDSDDTDDAGNKLDVHGETHSTRWK